MAEIKVTAVDGAVVERHDLASLFSGEGRDFLVKNNGDQVKVNNLEGKVVGIYFSASWCGPCHRFTPKLVGSYTELSLKNADLEVVFVSADEDEESFHKYFSGMPWLAVPFSDSATRKQLNELFTVQGIPHLVILDKNGEVVNDEGVQAVIEYGSEAYPFTKERTEELKAVEEAAKKNQTIQSVLVSSSRDFLISNTGNKVPVSELVGKNILLSFSAHWCPPCRAFLPKLVEAYNMIKAKDPAFEVIFISSDRDQASFDDYFASMPWLALPFGDERKASLSRTFKINGIPSLVAIGPTGKTVTKEARELIMVHGAEAFPFTEERVNELEAAAEEEAKQWPEKLQQHPLHQEHELVRTKRRGYNCDGCEEGGSGWSFYCKECDFDLHPKCALSKEDQEKVEDDNEVKVEKEGDDTEVKVEKEGDDTEVKVEKEGYVCDGEVCYKA